MIDLTTLSLARGSHRNRDAGTCLMEAVAWFAGLPHSDHPSCTSPVLGQFGRELNDVLGDDKRQLLVRLIPRMVETAGDGLDEARGYLALDWFVRTYTTAWLDLAGLTAEATALRDLRQIVDSATAQAADPVVRAARAAADAAADAAPAAAVDAAWDATADAAGDAAWAAWDAAPAAAVDAATAAAWAAAGAAAWAATGAAARAAAAGAALAPTVDHLQDSAIDLLDAMILDVDVTA